MSNLIALQRYLSILTRFSWKSPNHTFATRCIRALGSFVVSLIQTSATERYQPLSPSCLGLDMKIWKSRGAKIMAKLGWTQTMLWSGSPTQHPPTLCGKAWDETFDKVRCKNPNLQNIWALKLWPLVFSKKMTWATEIPSWEDWWATFDVERRKL